MIAIKREHRVVKIIVILMENVTAKQDLTMTNARNAKIPTKRYHQKLESNVKVSAV